MTPGPILIVHVIAVMWLGADGERTGGHTIPYPPTRFPSYEACSKVLPAYQEAFGEQIAGRGVFDCVPK